jgi:hypothetical protein
LQLAGAVAHQKEIEAETALGAPGGKADPVERAQGAACQRYADGTARVDRRRGDRRTDFGYCIAATRDCRRGR